MIVSLRVLSSTFGGQGNDVSRSLGLWVDRRGGRRTAEGMGLESSSVDYGFGWLSGLFRRHQQVFNTSEHFLTGFGVGRRREQYRWSWEEKVGQQVV